MFMMRQQVRRNNKTRVHTSQSQDLVQIDLLGQCAIRHHIFKRYSTVDIVGGQERDLSQPDDFPELDGEIGVGEPGGDALF